MENLKTILGVTLVFLGLGLFSFKGAFSNAFVIGVVMLVLGILILFTKRDISTKGSGFGWHVGNSKDDGHE